MLVNYVLKLLKKFQSTRNLFQFLYFSTKLAVIYILVRIITLDLLFRTINLDFVKVMYKIQVFIIFQPIKTTTHLMSYLNLAFLYIEAAIP